MKDSDKATINTIIINDEGGWVLTENKNDPDGGWTYAGVTQKTFKAFCDKRATKPIYWELDEIKKELEEDEEGVKSTIYDIYYEEFVQPLYSHFNGDAIIPAAVDDYELSCAINCGIEIALKISTQAMVGKDLYKDTFLNEWHKHYIELVRKNAEAWRDYALALEKQILTGGPAALDINKPSTLRAETLLGWFNRVERYRK